MSFRDNTAGDPGDGEAFPQDHKKIIPSKNSGISIPEIGKGRLYFRLIDSSQEAFGHYMEFWLNLGLNSQTQNPLLVPKVSPNPFSDFISTNSRSGKKYVGRSAAAFGCPLSKLADAKHPLIALNTLKKDKDGNMKPNVDPCHVTPVQIVEPVKDAATGQVIIENGSPKVKVLPEMYILKFRQGWWDQFLNIVEPQDAPAAAVNDGMTDAVAPAAAAKKLPTTDLTKIVWFLEKRVRTVNPTGNPKMDVDYVLSFSEKIVLTPELIPVPTGAVDFHSVMQSPSAEELAKMVIAAEIRTGMRPSQAQAPAQFGEQVAVPKADDSKSWGQQVPRGEAVAVAAPVATAAQVQEMSAAAMTQKDPF